MEHIKSTLELFSNQVKELFDDRLESIILTGSMARGDFSTNSDIDLWIILDHVSVEDLEAISSATKDITTKYEINSQCLTLKELKESSFPGSNIALQIYFDGVFLYGSLELERPLRSEIIKEAINIAHSVMMGARHYIVSSEPTQLLLNGKIQKWLLKPLSWVIRYERLISVGFYPKESNDLLGKIRDDRYSLMKLYLDSVAGKDLSVEPGQALKEIHRVAKDILSLMGLWLEEEYVDEVIHEGVYSSEKCEIFKPVDSSSRSGTYYYELSCKELNLRHWDEESIYINADAFRFIEHCFERSFKGFGAYGPNHLQKGHIKTLLRELSKFKKEIENDEKAFKGMSTSEIELWRYVDPNLIQDRLIALINNIIIFINDEASESNSLWVLGI